MNKKYLNAKEAADRLGISPRTLYNWKSKGMLMPFFTKYGGRLRFREDKLQEFIDQHYG